MANFPSVDDAKMEILQDQVDSVANSLFATNLLKKFCLDCEEEKLAIPSLEKLSNQKSFFLHLSDAMGMDAKIKRDGSIIISKDAEPSHPRSNFLELAPTSKSILTECMKTIQTDLDIPVSNEPKPINAKGSRCAGRLSLVGPPPVIGQYLGEEPGAVFARRQLPIHKHQQEIQKFIERNKVVLITGDPGSGKTTQVPQYILEHSEKLQSPCRIVSILPRRISAQAIAERVKYERGVTGARLVGFQTRLDCRANSSFQIIFCTTGVFLHTLMDGDRLLEGITHVVVDEVDSRDRYTDLLLGAMKTRIIRYPNVRLVLLSSNTTCWSLASYFNCPFIKISSSIKPHSIFHLEDLLPYTKCLTRKQDEFTEEDISAINSPFDKGIASAWLNGSEEDFICMQNYISSGVMPVDYQHSLTGFTLLAAAVIHGRVDVVKSLISCGANPNLKVSGMTPFDLANQFVRPNVADLLLTYSESFQYEIGSSIVESNSENCSSDDITSAYYIKYSKDQVNLDLVIQVIHYALGYSAPGTILVILPGYREVIELRDIINSNQPKIKEKLDVHILHSYLQIGDYNKLYQPAQEGKRKVILATPMVETAVSFDDITCVIDSGLFRERDNDSIIANPKKTLPITKSSAELRALQTRNGGIIFRLYSRRRYDSFIDSTVPEITRVELTDICLHARFLLPNDGRLSQFFCSLPDSPPTTSVQKAIETLQYIGALDVAQRATNVGWRLVEMPVEPRLGKMILASIALKCLDPVVTIVSCLSRYDPFIIPADTEQRKAALARKAELAGDTLSDHMALLKAYLLWESASEPNRHHICRENFLSVADFESILLLRVQLIGELRASGYFRNKGSGDIRSLNVHSESWTAIKAALTTGLYPNVGRYSLASGGVMTQNEFRGQFHFSSTLLFQESKLQLLGSDSYFGPPYFGSQMNFRASLLDCPWLIFQDFEKYGPSGVLHCCSTVTPVTALICSSHSRLPTVQLVQLSDEQQERISAIWDENYDSDEIDDDEMRSLCEEVNVTHMIDHLVAHNNKVRALKHKERIQAFGRKRYVQLKIDNFLSFTSEQTIAQWILILRMKFHIVIEKCISEPGYYMTAGEESVIKAVLQILSSEDTAIRLPQPGTGIGRRPTNVSADSILVTPELKPEELCLIKRYENYNPPPKGRVHLSTQRVPVVSKSRFNMSSGSNKSPMESISQSPEVFQLHEMAASLPSSSATQGRPIFKSFASSESFSFFSK